MAPHDPRGTPLVRYASAGSDPAYQAAYELQEPLLL